MSVLVAVTNHAAERFRQRIGSAGAVDVKPEIVQRVVRAWDAGRWSDEAPAGVKADKRGSVYVRDLVDRSLVFICRRDGAEVLVVTLWEVEGGVGGPKVPQRFTNALKRDDERPADNDGRS